MTLSVPGKPVPKGRARHGKGRTYSDPVTATYERKVRFYALQAAKEHNRAWVPIDSPVAVRMEFWMPTRRRIDLDNLIKSVWDGCNKVLWMDDSQIHSLSAHRTYAPEAKFGVVMQVEWGDPEFGDS